MHQPHSDRRGLLPVFALFVALAAAGCAPRTKLSIWRPASVDVAGIERLTILDFDGEKESGRIARAALQSAFWENKHYTLVEPAELARYKPIHLPDGRTDVAAAIDAGRLAGVNALLHGQVVSYSVDDDLQTNHHIEVFGASSSNAKSGANGSSGGVGLDSTQTLTREASVSLALKLIDVRSGEIRVAKQFAHTFHGQRVNGSGELPGRERILTELLHHCSSDAVTLLAPHYEPLEVKLAKQYWGKGLSKVSQGNKLAQNGDWAAAEAAWTAAARENPTNHAARFNVALAALARQDYAKARKYSDEAIKVYAAKEYQQFRKELEGHEKGYQAALAQANARRNHTLIANLPPPPGIVAQVALAPPPSPPQPQPPPAPQPWAPPQAAPLVYGPPPSTPPAYFPPGATQPFPPPPGTSTPAIPAPAMAPPSSAPPQDPAFVLPAGAYPPPQPLPAQPIFAQPAAYPPAASPGAP